MLTDKVERVTRLYERDQAENRQAVALDDIPIRWEAITDEWLTAVLCRNHPGARVSGHALGERDDGTSGRRRIFLEYNDAGEAAVLPRTVFGKASQELVHRIGYVMNGTFGRETNFYNLVRPQIRIECPRAYFGNYDPESCNSIILLEDMKGRSTFCDETTSISYDQAVEIATLLADLHAPFNDPARLATISGKIDTWADHWQFCVENQLDEYSNKGFLRAEPVIPARLFARYAEVWPRTMDSVVAQGLLPPTFTHGDTHCANWFTTEDGHMGLSDWQGCAIGHWARDVAYAFATLLAIDDRRAWERELLAIYLERWQAHGQPVPASFDDAWLYYRQQMLSALAYWTVTYTPSPGMPENMQPQDRALVFVNRLSTAADDLDSLDSF